MYHSILIDLTNSNTFAKDKSINTFDDWFLIPESRPTIANPSVRTSYIEVPGASGSIDATDWLSGFPLYDDREGDLVFYVENDHGPWTTRRNNINALVHGKKIKMMLEDEQDYFYIGRLGVNDWSSEKDWSKITFKYRLEPFKYSINSTVKWKWDPFNFDSGIIYEAAYSNITSSGVRYFNSSVLPITPSYGTVTVKNATPSVQIRFVNSELHIDETVTAYNGKTLFPELLFSNLSGNNLVTISIVNTGSVDFDVVFRRI